MRVRMRLRTGVFCEYVRNFSSCDATNSNPVVLFDGCSERRILNFGIDFTKGLRLSLSVMTPQFFHT